MKKALIFFILFPFIITLYPIYLFLILFSKLIRKFAVHKMSKNNDMPKKQENIDRITAEYKVISTEINDDFSLKENKDISLALKHQENRKNLLEEHNISQQRFDKAFGFLDRPIFKETLNPTLRDDLFTIETDEFSLLNDFGLIRQDLNYPFLITISNNEFDVRMAKNFQFFEKGRKVKIPLSTDFNNLENGFQFEVQIAKLLIDLNYDNVVVLPPTGDYGADILAEKNKVSFAIQCKYYSSPVGLSAVQEISSGKQHYNSQLGVVITNATFTQPAINLAKTNGIALWDGNELQNMIEKANSTLS